MKLKYPIKLGACFYPVNTEVRAATLAEMQQVWPQIDFKKSSQHVGVWLPERTMPTILHVDQLDGAS